MKLEGGRCPICRHWYNAVWKKAGDVCGDESSAPVKPCPGILVAESIDWPDPPHMTA